MKLNNEQISLLKLLLTEITDKEIELKEIINHFLSEKEDKQEEAFARLYKFCADNSIDNAIHAHYLLGNCYFFGIGLKQKYNQALEEKKALEIFQILAEKGYVWSQYNLALIYDEGDGVAVDKIKAATLYQRAADQGHKDAQYNLALMYDEGDGVAIDKVKAATLYQLAADQGHKDAQYNLALMYEKGEGIPQNKIKAFKLYQLSAAQEVPEACFNLAKMYLNQDPIDYKTALEYYQLYYELTEDLEAIELFYAETIHFISGMKRDRTKAILIALYQLQQWQKQEIEQAPTRKQAKKQARIQAKKQAKLKRFYAEDPNYPRDLKSTIEAYQFLAKSDCHEITKQESKITNENKRKILDLLGFCYQFGIGVIQDLKCARDYYQEAIELGSIESYYHLYFCYHQGLRKNLFEKSEIIERFKYYVDSHTGNIEPIHILAEIYEKGWDGHSPIDISKALELYQKALELYQKTNSMIQDNPNPLEQERCILFAKKITTLEPLFNLSSEIAGAIGSVLFSGGPLPASLRDLVVQYVIEAPQPKEELQSQKEATPSPIHSQQNATAATPGLASNARKSCTIM